MALAALKRKSELWEEAVNAFEGEDYEGSLSKFQAMGPNSMIDMNMGFIYTIQGNHENAMSHYTKAVALDTYLALAYFQRGVSHARLEQFEEAEADFCTAEIMMKGEVSWSYNESGLEFILHSAEILFNKALTIVKSGREQEAMVILRRADSLRSTLEHRVILDAMENIHGDYPYFCVPSHAIYRPSPSKLRFLKNYRPSPNAENAISPSVSAPELNDNKLHSDSDSDTCAGSSESLPLDKSKLGVSTCTGPSVGSMPDIFAASSSSSSRPMRSDLVRVIGIDMIAPVTEISTIPCAGIRISHGKLAGLMAWRLVVCLDDQKEVMTKRQLMKQRHWKDVQLGKSVVTNFLLDTGCSASPIPQETLRALGYRGSYRPGTEVMVRIQGVRTKCVIAHLGEAGRLGSQFLTSGSLTFHFAQKMDAPVLYVADESGSGSTDIPRTIEPDRKSRRLSLKEGVTALMSTLGLS